MTEAIDFLSRHGALVMFIALFIEQVGLPFPATPFLVVAGGLIGTQRLEWLPAIGAAVAGSILADMIWFYIGVKSGHRAVKFVCRVSLEPDSCVRRTQDLLAKYGTSGLILGKFIPGLSTLLPPLAGSSGMKPLRFAAVDLVSSVIYCGSVMLLGFIFSNQIEQILGALASLGHKALILLGSAIALWLAFKFYQRQRLLRELRITRITVDELRKWQEEGASPFVLDLRPVSEQTSDPWLIPGALRMTLDEVERRKSEIPNDREVVLYCSCPNEVTSAKVALLLKRSGIARVRPLLGGIDAWRERNYPLDPLHAVPVQE